ncbi:MAG: histidine kinase [Bacteroidia bacterium]
MYSKGLGKLIVGDSLELRFYQNMYEKDRRRKDYSYLWDIDRADSCRFWLSANGGLVLYDWCADSVLSIHKLEPSGRYGLNTVFCTLPQNDTIFWMGNWGGGLNSLNPKTGAVKHFGRKEGLSSTDVYGILEDDTKHLWMSTNKGLFRFDPIKEVFTRFGTEDGLVSNEFDSGAYFEAEDGEMFFGGRNGFVSFYPKNIKRTQDAQASGVCLTEIQVSGIRFEGATHVEELDRLVFPFSRQQSLEISFTSFHFGTSQSPQYRYRMKGYESMWNKPTIRPSARYTSLPPGDYIFEVALLNENGIDTASLKTLPIRIRPLLYQRLWFQISLGAFFFISIALGIYLRAKNENRRERENLQRRIAEVKQEALAAQFDQHFTFNSLNSIQRFITENKKEEAVRYISRFGKLIRRVMMQAKETTIILDDEIQSLDLYLSLEHLRTKAHFDYSIDVEKSLDPFVIEIPSMLIQPFVENAIWHGLMPGVKGGKLTINFRRKDNYLLCTVEDNGIGRKQSEILKQQSMLKHTSRGTTLIQERIDAFNALDLGGEALRLNILDLQDDQGKGIGTRVEIAVPMEQLVYE